jgi:hypothetical protein
MKSSITTGKVVGAVVGLLFLGLTVYVVSKAWKKGQAV